MINAIVITIGDEILIGQTLDTNTGWISQELNKIGVWVKKRIAVGDIWDDIWKVLDDSSKEADIIIMTGGLGPTADDITKPLLAKYFESEWKTDDQSVKHIRYLFEQIFKREVTERNLKQAIVPEACQVLFNEKGTAPGMWFEKDNKVFISLPGVPHEMKHMVSKILLPRIQSTFKMSVIIHQTLVTYGIGESYLADHIQHWEENLPKHIKLAYLPNYGMVRLRLSTQGEDKNTLELDIEKSFAELKEFVKEWLVIDEDMSIQETVGKLLKERKQTVGTAESCTGGFIAHLLTMNAGASSNFKGTVVSYDNQVKKDILGVDETLFETVGAVSEDVVIQMVEGVLRELKTDYAIATSGIMGPDGGSENKPVGMVWIAVGNKDHIVTQEFHFRFDRMRNIQQTSYTALNMLRKFINNYVESETYNAE
ncbi:MAG: competence/damage-inducible protein A [Chitinophagaceae bacterium]|jgi:nicotinamide-nucleotide amidase|nr:competence/damage-inducible protein A [Chitinophagaceae bacterium]